MVLILGVDMDQYTYFDFSFDFAKSGARQQNKFVYICEIKGVISFNHMNSY